MRVRGGGVQRPSGGRVQVRLLASGPTCDGVPRSVRPTADKPGKYRFASVSLTMTTASLSGVSDAVNARPSIMVAPMVSK
jgi:hypothetical protein